MDRQQMERCLERVAAYRASGLKGNEWAAANGVSIRELASWSAHARRWQAQLEGVAYEPAVAPRRVSGFVAAAVPAAAAASVRVEFGAGAAAVVMHWPLSHARELSACLRELAR